MIKVTVGKVPGNVVEIEVEEGTTVKEALVKGSRVGEFKFTAEEYSEGGEKKVDIPYLNGVELAEKNGDRFVRILWETVVNEGDTVLIVPKIQGN